MDRQMWSEAWQAPSFLACERLLPVRARMEDASQHKGLHTIPRMAFHSLTPPPSLELAGGEFATCRTTSAPPSLSTSASLPGEIRLSSMAVMSGFEIHMHLTPLLSRYARCQQLASRRQYRPLHRYCPNLAHRQEQSDQQSIAPIVQRTVLRSAYTNPQNHLPTCDTY